MIFRLTVTKTVKSVMTHDKPSSHLCSIQFIWRCCWILREIYYRSTQSDDLYVTSPCRKIGFDSAKNRRKCYERHGSLLEVRWRKKNGELRVSADEAGLFIARNDISIVMEMCRRIWSTSKQVWSSILQPTMLLRSLCIARYIEAIKHV